VEEFDVLVVGSGSGMIVVANAAGSGLKTALVESGPIGGTCLNRGCVPSKMLIYPADVAATLREVAKIGIKATVDSIDFRKIMDRMHQLVNEDSGQQAKSVEANPNITWFKDVAEFVSDYTLQVGSRRVKANKVFIVSGARPDVPKFRGTERVSYLTSDTVLNLEALPKSMIVVGGGYVAAEYGHFFSSLGTNVTVIQRSSRILPDEEPEISDLLKEEMGKTVGIFTGYEAVEVKENDSLKTVVAKDLRTGLLKEFSAESLLVATGRVPNSDILKPERTGVELDKRGYIKVDEFLETRKKNIYAFGDAIGKQMFKHVANFEAEIAWHNSSHDHKIKMDYSAAPHAVFCHPQVASVGLKEEEAKRQRRKILVGRASYKDTAQGAAMGEPSGFAKVIVDHDTGKVLGGHIVGPYASILIQEVINAMAAGDQTFMPIVRGLHIHPAMSEIVQIAFANLKEH
jgi:dihydrolipoamide dehydrogenase